MMLLISMNDNIDGHDSDDNADRETMLTASRKTMRTRIDFNV